MFKNFITFFLILILTSVCYANSDYLIIPGVSVGGAVIGKTTGKQMLKWMGEPDRIIGDDNGGLMYYSAYKLIYRFDLNSSLEWVIIKNPYYKTAEGFGVNSKIEDVKKTYPEGKLTDTKNDKKYYIDGIIFFFNSHGLIDSIMVGAKQI